MKDLMLIIVTIAAFVFGFYIIKKVDDIISENQRQITAENRNSRCLIRIAAETSILLDSAASALENCSATHPYLEFFLSSGKANRLLHKLLEGSVDIVLLSEERGKNLSTEYVFIQIPDQKNQSVTAMPGVSVENLDKDRWIYVVWNKSIKSKNRDRVIFALENDHCRLKCGYCDYLG